MLSYNKLADSVDVSVVVRIVDATDGTPETGVVWNTGGIDMWYRRELAASVDITEATLAALTTAHTDGGFLHINDGYYRLDPPDAACVAGTTGVLVGGAVTGMIVEGCYIHLSSVPVDVSAIADEVQTRTIAAVTMVSGLSPSARGAIVDDILDEATSSHVIPGSEGAALAGLTFTVPGEVDCNIKSANNEPVGGTGTTADPWSPV